MKTYQIAQTLKEAKLQASLGFGYASKKAAETALSDPKIDDYYRNKLKVYVVEVEAPKYEP